jgi:hypothetical protein
MTFGRSRRAGARTSDAPVARTASATPGQPAAPGSHTPTVAPASASSSASANRRSRFVEPVWARPARPVASASGK